MIVYANISLRTHRPQGSGWRAALAYSLRRLSQKIDGRMTCTVETETHPDIGASQSWACIQAGIKTTARLMQDAAAAESMEEVMRELTPELYDDEGSE